MKINSKSISFIITLLLASFALISVIPVSYRTLLNENPCPNIGFLPACYIVTLAYALVILSLFKVKRRIFYIGWLPIFLLALSGTTIELLGHTACPKSTTGTPLCYYSLSVSIIVLIFYNIFYKQKVLSNK